MGAHRKPLDEACANSAGRGHQRDCAGSFARPERVERGMEALRELGFRAAGLRRTRWSADRSTLPERRSSGSPICTRLLKTRQLSMVMCLRGGYGSNYLLEGLDLELIARHPKPFFAYSDLTGIQLRLLDRAGTARVSRADGGRGFLSRRRRASGELSGGACAARPIAWARAKDCAR